MDAKQPPTVPPKPGSHETSRKGTPITSHALGMAPGTDAAHLMQGRDIPKHEGVSDPGNQWLPRFLEIKSLQELAEILADPKLLAAVTHAPETIHPSLKVSYERLQLALAENVDTAAYLMGQEALLSSQRSDAQAQLLSTHVLERQWRQKQTDMDRALEPFSPGSLYQRLSQGNHERALVCQALEDSFLDGDGGGAMAAERDVLDWVRRYREVRLQFYLGKERKERWDEGRVGGWR